MTITFDPTYGRTGMYRASYHGYTTIGYAVEDAIRRVYKLYQAGLTK